MIVKYISCFKTRRLVLKLAAIHNDKYSDLHVYLFKNVSAFRIRMYESYI